MIKKSFSLGLLRKEIESFSQEISFLNNCDFIICCFLNKKRKDIFLELHTPISQKKYLFLFKKIKEYFSGIPLEYILSHSYFYDSFFYVNKNTLIPRQCTEILIDAVYDFVKNISKKYKKIKIYDIGTGSGIIITSISKKCSFLKNIEYTGIDISPSALNIARLNFCRISDGISCNFIKNNLLENYSFKEEQDIYYIFVANLPYVSEQEYKNNICETSVKNNEPFIALVSEDNGLFHYKTLLSQLKSSQIQNYAFWGEISPMQKENIQLYIKNNFQKESLFISDQENKTRFFHFMENF
jgi:release factor glutamine methyltransferase